MLLFSSDLPFIYVKLTEYLHCVSDYSFRTIKYYEGRIKLNLPNHGRKDPSTVIRLVKCFSNNAISKINSFGYSSKNSSFSSSSDENRRRKSPTEQCQSRNSTKVNFVSYMNSAIVLKQYVFFCLIFISFVVKIICVRISLILLRNFSGIPTFHRT